MNTTDPAVTRAAPARLALHWKILIGLALGVVAGVAINLGWSASTWASLGVNDAAAFMAGTTPAADPAANQGAGAAAQAVKAVVKLNQLVGDLFVRALRLIAVPIVLFSLILAVGQLGDLRKLGRMGSATVGIFVVTTALSVALGLAIANSVKPGAFVPEELRDAMLNQNAAAATARIQSAETTDVWRVITNVLPTNPFDALARGDMLQVVIFSLLLGAALSVMPASASAPALKFCESVCEAVLVIVGWIMRCAPVGVFCLIVGVVAMLGLDVLTALLAYSLCVVGGLLGILLLIYPAMLKLLGGRGGVGVLEFYKGLSPAMLLAFSSSSSSATLPVTIKCTSERLGVPRDAASFVCAMGATINMNGTALMQAVATVFIAQLFATDLTLTQQLTIVLIATLSAIGSPGIPSGGIVMLVIVLESVGLPPQGIAVILAVDRVLDMCRTVVNVTGDAAAAVVVAGRRAPAPAAAAA